MGVPHQDRNNPRRPRWLVAEQGVAHNPRDPDNMMTLGAALYRAGRFEAAAKVLADAEAAYAREQATPSPGIFVSTSVAYGRFFLAMTHQRLNHHEEAQRWLDEAVAPAAASSAPATQPLTTQPLHPVPWNRAVTTQRLRREAEALFAVHADESPAKP